MQQCGSVVVLCRLTLDVLVQALGGVRPRAAGGVDGEEVGEEGGEGGGEEGGEEAGEEGAVGDEEGATGGGRVGSANPLTISSAHRATKAAAKGGGAAAGGGARANSSRANRRDWVSREERARVLLSQLQASAPLYTRAEFPPELPTDGDSAAGGKAGKRPKPKPPPPKAPPPSSRRA